ncbi:MAG: ferritin family protein [Phycisphaerae bacterium]|nr:ferritin family protein [Phycisphaerae bacterium]
MAELFEITELVKIGIDDEKAGVGFYQTMAERADNERLKAIFADLADQERYHQRRFEQMLEDLGGHTPSREQYAGEYRQYLQALTSDRAFPDPDAARKMAQECPDDRSAVELAVRFERDTLLLMHEMASLMPDKHRDVVNDLAEEEQSHLVTLADARRQL